MNDLVVKRIAAGLKKKYGDLTDVKIDISDMFQVTEQSYLTRALAAYAVVMTSGISVDDSINAITDGGQDGGIDAIYYDINNTKLIFVQSKYVTKDSGISQGDVLKFVDGIEKVISSDTMHLNAKVKNHQKEVEDAICSFDCRIEAIIISTSTQELSTEALDALEKLKNRLNDGGIDCFDYKLYKQIDIYNALAKDVSLQSIDIEKFNIMDWGTLTQDDKKVGYYGKVSAATVGEWWKNYGLSLFEKNIRYYKGTTDVNNGIKNVILNHPEKLLIYNNGIKIVAQEVKKGIGDRKVGLFSLKQASIVNGAQTTGTIGELYISNPKACQNAYLLLQIINLGCLPDENIDLITRYSNTQNKIDNKDFVALDSFHVRLQKDFAMEGINYFFKTGHKGQNKDNSCNIDDVTVAIGCATGDMSIVSTIKSNYGKIFERTDRPPYTNIFNKSFSTYYIWNCIQIYRKFDVLNDKYQKENSGTNRLVSIHGNRFLLSVFLNAFTADYDLNSRFLSDEKITELNEVINDKISLIIDKLVEIKNDTFPDAYPANIFKNGNRCKELFDVLVNTDTYKSMRRKGIAVR